MGTFSDDFSPLFVVVGPGQTSTGSVSYLIDPPAPVGFISAGTLVVTYDLFACDPNDAQCDPSNAQTGFSLTLETPASIEVGEIPEPSSALLALGGLAALWARKLRA